MAWFAETIQTWKKEFSEACKLTKVSVYSSPIGRQKVTIWIEVFCDENGRLKSPSKQIELWRQHDIHFKNN